MTSFKIMQQLQGDFQNLCWRSFELSNGFRAGSLDVGDAPASIHEALSQI
jgi:hypothetical protein